MAKAALARHWADGGATSLANTCLLCQQHHVAVHEDGFRIERAANGELVFLAPDGRRLEPRCARAPLDDGAGLPAIVQTHAARGVGVNRTTSLPNWNGARLDLHAAVGPLAARVTVRSPHALPAPPR